MEGATKKNKGDEAHERSYLAVGKSLTMWENVEFSFVSLFCHFIEPRFPDHAKRAFGAPSSSDVRSQLLENVAEMYFHAHKVHSALKDEFFQLMENFKCARGRRNDIAHGAVFSIGEVGVFLIPALYGSRKNFAFAINDGDKLSVMKHSYRYTASDVDAITSKFQTLISAIWNFYFNFQKEYPPFDPSRRFALLTKPV